MRRHTVTARIPKEINMKLNQLSLELGVIEGKRVSVPDILNRTFSHTEIIDRLKIGSLEKRRFKNG